MRRWFLLVMLIVAGCTSAQITVTSTAPGALVPTRNIPTGTPPTAVALNVTATENVTTIALNPTDTPTAQTPTLTDTSAVVIAASTVTATTQASATTANTSSPVPSAMIANTATPVSTATFTDTISPTVAPTATIAPTSTFSDTPTVAPTATITPSVTSSDTPTQAATATQPPTATATAQPTNTATFTPIPTETLAPNLTPTQPTLYRPSTAQELVVLQGALTLDTPMSGTINDLHPAQLYSFSASANETIDVSMTAQSSGTLNPYLLLLDPKGREIVRNDNIDSDHKDAALHDVTVPETGIYVIVATRSGQAFGDSSGDFDLTVSNTTAGETSLGEFSQATAYESLVNGSLDASHTQDDYTIRAAAGDVISLSMTISSGDLDPILSITDNLGTIIAWNDDNERTGALDSVIENFIIPRSGYYTIVATHYLGGDGNSGDYRLKLTHTGQNDTDRFAILDMVNSTTISDQGTLYNEFAAGDMIDDNQQERSLQTLLTFRLPPDAGRQIQGASLILQPCQQYGGFAVLGDMTIYRDNFGKVDSGRNLTHALPGARILSVQSNCDDLDLTSLIQDAYATGLRDIKLRLVFRSRTDNGKGDEVYFTPRLMVSYTP